jgi:L-threonylcarbamoyladenylate synthase
MPVTPADPDHIARAARYLAQGGLVAFPSETVYGLGADASNGMAVAGVYSLKGRPTFNPLIIHVPSAELAWKFGVPTEAAEKLAAAFWPGPLTLVLRLRKGADVDPLALAGLSTIALRVPSHPMARELLRQAGRPIAAPSANRSGHVSPTTAAHVLTEFGDDVPIILDGGSTTVGLESTIVDVTGEDAILLRPGGVTREKIEHVLGKPLLTREASGAQGDAVTAPGQLESHYAPAAAVRLAVCDVRAGEALLAFGQPIAHAGPMLNLSPDENLIEAAAKLFSSLRALDETGVKAIAVMAIPNHGLGEAINDRLARAAAPRPSTAQ